MSKVAVLRCDSYNQYKVSNAISKTLAMIGIEQTFFYGKKVLIKPNCGGPSGPDEAATTHPSIVKAMVDIIKGYGGLVIVGESPVGGYLLTSKTFKVTGIADVTEITGVPLLDLGGDKLINTKINGHFFETLYLPKTALEADIIISMPKFKTHSLTTFTGAIKNVFGIVPGSLKSEFHRRAQKPAELAEAIVDLFPVVRPHLSIMDAIVGMEGEGPSAGSPRHIGYLMASEDAVALDAVCVEMIGLDWHTVDMVRIASERGQGEGDISKIEIIGPPISEIKIVDFNLPNTRKVENILNTWTHTFSTYGWLKPRVDENLCIGCTACNKDCPVGAIEMKDGIPNFNYDKCIRCYFCQEVCPESAINLKIDNSKKIVLKFVGGVSKASRLTRDFMRKS